MVLNIIAKLKEIYWTLRRSFFKILLPTKDLSFFLKDFDKSNLQNPSEERFLDAMIIPIAERGALASLCAYLKPKTVFEIGTYRGASSLIIAMNSPETTKIYTLDVASTVQGLFQPSINASLSHPTGEFFHNTPYTHQITQLLGDSRNFDYTPYYNQMDLVFIDANHDYEFVKNDSEQAFKLIRQGGTIIWDDYIWAEPYAKYRIGVSQYLHQIRSLKKIYHIQGTRLAIYIDE